MNEQERTFMSLIVICGLPLVGRFCAESWGMTELTPGSWYQLRFNIAPSGGAAYHLLQCFCL